jgi:hypothetical protein
MFIFSVGFYCVIEGEIDPQVTDSIFNTTSDL